ncbi:hypothetical protein Dimus_010459 [Dionaea muscipula]
MTLVHFKKKDVVRSSVRGVAIEFDHLKLASILSIPGNNGICEYIKDVWEESKYTKPLAIIRKFANDDNIILEARRVKSVEMKPFQRFIHFLVMKNMAPRFRKRDTTSFMDLIYMDHLVSRRIVNLQEEEEEEEAQNADFDWEAVVDEAADQGESGSGEKFYDAEDEIQESTAMVEEVPAVAAQASAQQKETEAGGVDPSGPSGHIPESVMIKLQANFERARANRIQVDLEKAQAENARLLALLQQAKNQAKP